MTATNDSDELEALFDSIASDIVAPAAPAQAPAPSPVAAPAAAPAPAASADGDNDDLQALFDSVATEYADAAQPASGEQSQSSAPDGSGASDAWAVQESVFNRIGQMARELHSNLHELGYEKLLENTMAALPDAQDRLAYVANLTEQAACKVLNATDVASPLVDQVESGSKALGARWDRLFANQLNVDEFKALAAETRAFLNGEMPQKAGQIRAQLTEIMMAQDFQDLTGQVIKKIVSLAQSLENGLMSVLIDVVPEAKRTEEVNSLMNGPVISAEGRTDVVVDQQQVDDLLDSLGF